LRPKCKTADVERSRTPLVVVSGIALLLPALRGAGIEPTEILREVWTEADA